MPIPAALPEPAPLTRERSHADFTLGDTVVRYTLSEKGALVALSLFPASLRDRLVAPRKYLAGPEVDGLPPYWQPLPAARFDPLVHVKLREEPCVSGFAHGHTMRNGELTHALEFSSQKIAEDAAGIIIETQLVHAKTGLRAVHRLRWPRDQQAFLVTTELRNEGAESLTVEMFTSASLGGITPFAADDAPGRLRVHRLRSAWAAECRPDVQSLEQLHLVPSWSAWGASVERFGQVGTHPVRKWFPFAAVEDAGAGVFWGFQVAHAGSWQIELYRRDDRLCVSGGLADREFGHWWRELAPGQSIVSPEARLACVAGDFTELTDRFVRLLEPALDEGPAVEQDLPILFNEWCSSWGHPSLAFLEKTLRKLEGTPAKIFVIDDGWAERVGDSPQTNGDWVVDQKKFPGGLRPASDLIRRHGLLPGLWFEFEVCNPGSKAWERGDLHLHRDGRVLQVGGRRFWDFTNPRVHEWLHERVTRLLAESGFAYLKVDYNDNLGIGVDGAESPGSGLVRHLEGVHRFFRELRAALPELIVENCASGGHRLEPTMLVHAAMASFSDAHETVEIPIIAAHLHHVLPPRMSQIWAVVHPTDTPERLAYSLAATFLGRMCLSGEIAAMPDASWALVVRAMEFYRGAVPAIKHGESRLHLHLEGPANWRHPQGWQALVRIARDGTQALVVLHTFAEPPASELRVPLPSASWKITDAYGEIDFPAARVEGGALVTASPGAFRGRAWLLQAR